MAQSADPAGSAPADQIPVQCWLKTTKTAVHVGEHFNLALTCSVLETPRLSAVPDVAQIEPATIQFPPFEVMGGVRHPDVRSGSRRYFQFEYTLRLIADGFFGRDLPIPPVTLKYNLSVSDGGSAQQGRERTYILPSIPLRVSSLVPQLTGDIRDASRHTFADIEKREFRSKAAFASAAILFAFAAVFLLLAATSGFARYRARIPDAERVLPVDTILAGCGRTLRRARQKASEVGWTPELVAQCLSALRIGAAVGLGRPVPQTVTTLDATGAEGQLVMRSGLLRPRKALLSAAVTPLAISEQLATNTPFVTPRLQSVLGQLRDALTVFSTVRYGSFVLPPATALDQALDESLGSLWRIRISMLAPIRLADAVARSAKRWSLAWTQ